MVYVLDPYNSVLKRLCFIFSQNMRIRDYEPLLAKGSVPHPLTRISLHVWYPALLCQGLYETTYEGEKVKVFPQPIIAVGAVGS